MTTLRVIQPNQIARELKPVVRDEVLEQAREIVDRVRSEGITALCELAQVPEHDEGILGDALNLLLIPETHLFSKEKDTSSILDEYITAMRQGAKQDDCSPYQETCPVSLFNVI